MNECIFCKIIRRESPSHIFWEDEHHVAFLNIFPNTEGAAVIATKEHYPSYVADMPEDKAKEFFWVATRVAKLLDEKLDDVGRTGIVFEGMGVDHVHAKLFPMHQTKDIVVKWKPFPKPAIDTYFEKYEGYLSTHSSHTKANDDKLADLAQKLRK